MTAKGKVVLRFAGSYLLGMVGAAVFFGQWPPLSAFVAFVIFIAAVSLLLDVTDYAMQRRGR